MRKAQLSPLPRAVRSSLSRRVVSPALVAGVLLSAAAGPALAQRSGAANGPDGGLEEVVVTARQTEESRLDVPATVTVLTAAQLEAAGVQRAEDFIELTPGVSMVNAAEVGDTQVNIRGINGARDAENSFAFVVDGILMTNPAAFNREYANLRQIEVLKGPQGAIYGRNAAAGAIIVTTDKPGPGFEGEFRTSAADDDTFFGSATIGGGLSPTAFYQLHADWRATDGFYFNQFQNNSRIVDDFRSTNVSGRLVLEPGTDTTWDIKARYGEVDAAAITFNAAFALPAFADVLGVPEFYEDVNAHDFVFQPNIDPRNEQEALEFSVKLDHRFAWADLTAWFLYSDIENSLSADGTSGAFGFFNSEPTCRATTEGLFLAGVTVPAPTFLAPTPEASILGPYTPTSCDGTQYQVRNQEDFSFEARFSRQASERLFWQGGFYYLNLEREVGVNLGIDTGNGVTPQLFVPPTGTNPTEQLVHDRFDTEVFAVFGRVDYDLSDTLALSAAVRYDREEREVTNLVPTDARTQYVDFSLDGQFTGNAPLNPGLDPNLNPGGIVPQSETFDQVQPKLSLTWDATDAWTLYGSWGIGFKSGGFNNQGSNATVDLFYNTALGTDVLIEDQFDEETSSAFELGFKANPTDRVYLEGAVYRTDVDDMQFFEFLVGPFGLLRVVSNIDEVRITGAEIGLNWEVTDSFTLGAGYNVTDSEIDENASRPGTVGNESPYTPEYTANLVANYVRPIGDGWDLTANVTWSFIGETWFHTVQAQENITLFNAIFPGLGIGDYTRTQRDAYDLVDARLGVRNENWSVTLFGTNLTDENFLEEVIVAPEFGGSFVHPGTLRRLGLEVSYRF